MNHTPNPDPDPAPCPCFPHTSTVKGGAASECRHGRRPWEYCPECAGE